MARLFVVAVLSLSMFCAAGCNTIRYGGAPEASFDIKKDLQDLEREYGQAASVSEYFKAPGLDARNRFIAGRLVLMNLHYVQFVRDTTQDRQLTDAASDILILSLNLAGAAFRPETTKTTLAVLSAMVAGTKLTVDKEFFFDKTMPALVAAMNAERKQALIPILEGMGKDLQHYPFEQALSDLHDYYMAGTFYGAIQAIQSDAGKKSEEAQQKIAEIVPLTSTIIGVKATNTDAIDAIADSPDNLTKVHAVLKQLDDNPPDPTTLSFAEAKARLKRVNRNARTPDRINAVHDAMKQQGLTQ